MKAVLFISHGSRLPKTEEEVRSFVEKLKQRSHVTIFEYAFLDVMPPSISEGIDTCVRKGATEIIILMNFLNTGRHVGEDVPYIIDKARERYPNVVFHLTKPVGHHDRIIDLFIDMIDENNQP
jgi:sirohydrochlorin ferrochelatase